MEVHVLISALSGPVPASRLFERVVCAVGGSLVREIERSEASLLVVAADQTAVPAGWLTPLRAAHEVLERGICSVLVARGDTARPRRPAGIVVGVDGAGTVQATLAARSLAERAGALVRFVAAAADSPMPLPGLAGDIELDPRPLLEALIDESRTADLLVVASGSSSTPDAYAHARCSVLVVLAHQQRAGR